MYSPRRAIPQLHMKTTKIVIGTICAVIFFSASSVSAGEVSFVPSEYGKHDLEQEFHLRIDIEPTDASSHEARMVLIYPPDLLAIETFDFGEGWISIIEPESDFKNNPLGLLIKTATYEGEINSKTVFGTVTFLTKKSGFGAVTLSSSSYILNENRKNILRDKRVQTLVTLDSQFRLEDIPPSYLFTRELKKGDKGTGVRYLQLCLQLDDVYNGIISGLFKEDTTEAVIAFQEKYADDILAPHSLTKGTGNVGEVTIKKLNDICVPQLPDELFDISLIIDDQSFTTDETLAALVIFESFGRNPTPVTITFTVRDSDENVLYTDTGYTMVETEKILRKEFDTVVFTPGDYVLTIRTQYSRDVIDEFTKNFTVTITTNKLISNSIIVIIAGLLLPLLGALYYYFIFRKKETPHPSIE